PHRRGADRRALGTRPAHARGVRRRRPALRGHAGHAPPHPCSGGVHMNDIADSPLMVWLLANPLLGPFAEFGFMRDALLGCVALSLSSAPVGVFLMLRRMSLTGDAMAHAI